MDTSCCVDKRCPLEYIMKMHTVVETPSYLKAAEKLFSAEEREAIVAMVSDDPECGAIIQGTGGFRKVRFRREGMGKLGGSRIVFTMKSFPFFLSLPTPRTRRRISPKRSAMSLRSWRAQSSQSTGGNHEQNV